MTRTIRIFISSPGDVSNERDALESLIKNDLQSTLGRQHNLHLEPMRWEKMVTPGMGDIQKKVYEEMGPYDIFVGIFWKRFGTPTSEYGSGSEDEFRHAYRQWEEDNSRPVMMYFCEKAASVDLDTDPEEAMKQFQQAQKVKGFREELGEKGLYWRYTELEEFRELTHRHLYTTITALIEKRTPKIPAEPKPEKPLDTEARRRYLKNFRKDCLRIPLTVMGKENVNVEGLKAVELDAVFVSLMVVPKPSDASDKELSTYSHERTMMALNAIDSAAHVILLGDPGSGKSSLVKHVLANIASCELDGEQPLLKETSELLPVLIVLRDLAPRLAQAKLPKDADERSKALAELVLAQATENAKVLKAGEFADGVSEAFEEGNVFLVFDGLDEVPLHLRPLIREAAGATLNQYDLKRIVTTCRIRSYTGVAVFEKVPTFTIQKLKSDQIRTFITRWYKAQGQLGWVAERDVEGQTKNLIGVAVEEPLLALAENPMLLTTMTLIHQRETQLPRERVKLYDLAVGLLLRRWQEGRGGGPSDLSIFIEAKGDKLRTTMERLAFEAHQSNLAQEAADLPRKKITTLLAGERYLGSKKLARQFLDYVDQRAGLLVGRGGSTEERATYNFPHRTFQEYLAGCYIMAERGAARRLRKLAKMGDYWWEAVLLGAEELMLVRKNQNTLLDVASKVTKEAPASDADSRATLWVSKLVALIGPEEVKLDEGDEETGQELLNRLQMQGVELLGGLLSPIERVDAGRTLATLGDPREGIMKLGAMPMCYVPPGPFLMGDDATEMDVRYGYWAGQYAVTQAQFQAFVEAGGYDDKQWWTDAGWKQKETGKWKDRESKGAQFDLSNHPVVGVSWYEAQAFTDWLTNHLHNEKQLDKGWRVALPNEPEWEKAARGGIEIPEEAVHAQLTALSSADLPGMIGNPLPARKYPWGEEFNPNYCNHNKLGTGTTSTPGCFPEGVSPYGLHDASGNVLEWSRSKYEAATYPVEGSKWTSREEKEGKKSRVLRGGSFGGTANYCRCAARNRGYPDLRRRNVGFRIVVLPLKPG